jgi:UDP:flavonoid glycosyltransferase YjiC (YdhE family)
LGHATRCVPIIKALLKKNNAVILGCTSLTEKILEQEFPRLERICLPEYSVSYSDKLPIWLKLVSQYSRIKSVINAENVMLQDLIRSRKIEVVVSDNRYGLYSKNIKSIMVCHQINVFTPFLNQFANKIHTTLLRNFNEIWVPDFEDGSKRLAGELSRNKHALNCNYIGPLSRLEKAPSEIEYDLLFMLSGPEPSQTNLLNSIISKVNSLRGKKIAIVSASETTLPLNDNVTFYKLPEAKQLSSIIARSKVIICRSGYSTLMDMFVLEKKELVLVPTKGQTEQEYLAEHWKNKFNASVLKETDLQHYNF